MAECLSAGFLGRDVFVDHIKDLSRLHIRVSAGERVAVVVKCLDNYDGWWCFRDTTQGCWKMDKLRA